MFTIKLKALVVLTIVVTMVTWTVSADVPRLVNYQGRLTDDLGSNVPDGLYQITFTIWDTEIDGTSKWSELHSDVNVNEGLFNVLLGSISSLPDSVFNQPSRWLGISVDGEQISPRVRLTSVPYAYHAQNLSLIPTDLPDECNESNKGKLYYDESKNEPCYCDGTNWMQLDGGGPCGDIACPDNDADGYDICDPGNPDDTDGLPADCDDGIAVMNPGEEEVCGDGLDNDCDGDTDYDDIDCSPCTDNDGDGYDICDPGNPDDTDGLPADCDDSNEFMNPGHEEVCGDGLDNDCDGDTDYDDIDCSPCPDNDGDGYDICNSGDPDDTDGLPADCDDSNEFMNPGHEEVCGDGLDNDCDGDTDYDDIDCSPCTDNDGDGYDICDPGNPDDTDGLPADCDDGNSFMNPGLEEVCGDGLDNDCDGDTDYDDIDCSPCPDNDGDGYDICNSGDPDDTDGLPADCDDSNEFMNPGHEEVCGDGLDNDCDGDTDYDDIDCSPCIDNDGDGYDICDPGNPDDTDGLPADCDDGNSFMNPGLEEVCGDGLDNDCDGDTDYDDFDCALSPGSGDLVITEFMANPDGVPDLQGEWIEIYNPTGSNISLQGITLEDAATNTHVITADVVVPIGGYVTLANSAAPGFTPDYVYSSVSLNNAGDQITLSIDATIIDQITYGTSTIGTSSELSTNHLDATSNDSVGNWCSAVSYYSASDLGTPGSVNDCSL